MDSKSLAQQRLRGCVEVRNCATATATPVAQGTQLGGSELRNKIEAFTSDLLSPQKRLFCVYVSHYLNDGLTEHDANLLAVRRMGGEVHDSEFEWQCTG